MAFDTIADTGLHVVESNHMEVLAVALSEWLNHHRAFNSSGPIQSDIIMVQSQGMQRWLSIAIAQHNGICANISYLFPNAFLEQLYFKVVGSEPVERYYEPLPMAFGIMKLLPELLERREFSYLRSYLEQDSHPLKEFQLARRIADVFDQYLVFRSDMLFAWERDDHTFTTDPPNHWQKILWRELTERAKTPHRAAMHRHLTHCLNALAVDAGLLPERLTVFGISHLPVFHMDVLATLAKHIPVGFFLMNPCRYYWADIVSEQYQVRIRQREIVPGDFPEADLHLERGNRLLASWGGQGRQFAGLIHGLDIQSTDLFVDNHRATLLGRLQQDILDLEDRFEAASHAEPISTDGSIQIHICHSRMREVEVLYDRLLDILEHSADIEPRDIVVMAPEIAPYAPYIHAVFGNDIGSGVRIPYSLADQSIDRDNPAIEAFLQIIDLVNGRFEASRVMALLEYEAIRNRFDMDEHDVAIAQSWTHDVNIRWGWDGADRKKHGLPAFDDNTWRCGLDRLLLGYAMISQDNRLFCDSLPSNPIEGAESKLLGNLIEFVETLQILLSSLTATATISQWREIFGAMLDRLFSADESTYLELQVLRETIDAIANAAELHDFTQAIPFEDLRHLIMETFKRSSHGTGFITGGIIFCTMLPMRSIPTKVVCLLGMQHDAFPHEVREPGFNLITMHPRAGDRSKRADDKYLFLETLISARRILYLSYVGRNQQDNTVIPPSVLIDELIDYLGENYNIAPERLTTVHPLQGFAPSYFNHALQGLFSYSLENCQASRSLLNPLPSKSFFGKILTPSPEHLRRCELANLIAFFCHPAKFIMERRLNIFLADWQEETDDRENFVMNALDRYHISHQFVMSQLDSRISRPTYAFQRADGNLPHGNPGKVVHRQMEYDASFFSRHVKNRLGPISPASKNIDIKTGPFELSGMIDDLYQDSRMVFRMALCRPQDLLTIFINHLVLNLAEDDAIPRQSTLICRDQVWHFEPMRAPQTALTHYLDLYRQGLQAPIPFFPRTSWAYAQKRYRGADLETAIKFARQKWVGNEFTKDWTGESADAYNHRCFGSKDPLNGQFEAIAISVCGPILENGSCETVQL